MGAPVPIRADIPPGELRRLARQETNCRVACRSLALANVLAGMSREVAARQAGMDRQTLRDWVIRFNAEGVGAVCPERDAGVALVLPAVSAAAMQAMVDELSQAVAPDTHPVVLVDRAGWHIARELDFPANLASFRRTSGAAPAAGAEEGG